MSIILEKVKKYFWVVLSILLTVLGVLLGAKYFRKKGSSRQEQRSKDVEKEVSSINAEEDSSISKAEELRKKIDNSTSMIEDNLKKAKEDVTKVDDNKDLDDSINSWNQK